MERRVERLRDWGKRKENSRVTDYSECENVQFLREY